MIPGSRHARARQRASIALYALCALAMSWPWWGAQAAPARPTTAHVAAAWRQALLLSTPWPEAEIQVQQVRARLPARCEQLVVEPEPAAVWSAQARAWLRCAGLKHAIPMTARLHVTVLAPVLSSPVGRAQHVEGAVRWERASLFGLPSDVVREPAQLKGYVARASLSQGQLVRHSALELPLLVTQGQLAQVVIRRGAVQVSDRVEVMTSGRAGDWISARSVSTHKVLRAQVSQDGALEVP